MHKFKIGDIVRHKAADIVGCSLLITAVGTLENADGKTLIYQCSYTSYSTGSFSRVILEEQEIEAKT